VPNPEERVKGFTKGARAANDAIAAIGKSKVNTGLLRKPVREFSDKHKMALGAAGALAALGVHKLWNKGRRNRSRDHYESVSQELQGGKLSKENKQRAKEAGQTFVYGRHPHGFVASAGEAAGGVAGTAAMMALLKKKRRKKLIKNLHKLTKDPYVRGAAGVLGVAGATKLVKDAYGSKKGKKDKNK